MREGRGRRGVRRGARRGVEEGERWKTRNRGVEKRREGIKERLSKVRVLGLYRKVVIKRTKERLKVNVEET